MAEEKKDLFEEIYGDKTKKEKKKKTRKVVRRRKTKKEKEKPLTAAIRLTVESGKVQFGARTSTKASLLGKAKLFVVAKNTPAAIKDRIGHYSEASQIPLLVFEGSSIELGSVCGKPYPISVLSVLEPGTSPILEMSK